MTIDDDPLATGRSDDEPAAPEGLSPEREASPDPFEAIRQEAEAQIARELPARSPLPEPPSTHEINARLRLKDAEILRQRQIAGYDRKSIRQRHEPGQSYHQGLAVGLAVAYNLVGSVLVGWLIGAAIDWATKGFLAQAIGTVLGAIIGMIAALMVIFRAPSGSNSSRSGKSRKPN